MPSGFRRVVGAAVVAASCALGGGATLAGQQQGFRSSVDLVPVFATVLAKDGSYVRGLTRDDFTVLDDGKPQEIVSFSAEAQAISVSMILDTSRTMAGALPRVFAAAGVFLNQLRADDRAMVGSLIYQGPPFTAGKNADIVVKGQGRAPVAASKPTAASILARVEHEGVMVYAIGFEGLRLTDDMKAIAQRSGGRGTELKKADDLGTALAGVADELHQQYLLGFTPTAFDGRVHTITVRVRSADQTVRARQTYVAMGGTLGGT